MTPSFCWVFLLAFLVGRTASIPQAIVVDACALLCNPGAETESDRARDPILYPKVAKANCNPQFLTNEEQARVIARHCLKLCGYNLTVASEVNCFTLRSTLIANAGCYCDALRPLSPNTIQLNQSWRLKFMVNEVAKDITNVVTESPLDVIILCEVYKELFDGKANLNQEDLYKMCHAEDVTIHNLYSYANKNEKIDSKERRRRNINDDLPNKDHNIEEAPNKMLNEQNPINAKPINSKLRRRVEYMDDEDDEDYKDDQAADQAVNYANNPDKTTSQKRCSVPC